jgi:hypothetical protein
MAEAQGTKDHAAEDVTTLDEALAVADETGEQWYDAELWRLKGKLVLQSGVRGPESQEERQKSKDKNRKKKLSVVSSQLSIPSPQLLAPSIQAAVKQEAEECFLKAIEIARKQQAKSLELRATMSPVRLRQRQAQGHVSRTTQHGSRITQHETRPRLDEAHRMLSEVPESTDKNMELIVAPCVYAACL